MYLQEPLSATNVVHLNVNIDKWTKKIILINSQVSKYGQKV
jgi:hypothetical protein